MRPDPQASKPQGHNDLRDSANNFRDLQSVISPVLDVIWAARNMESPFVPFAAYR